MYTLKDIGQQNHHYHHQSLFKHDMLIRKMAFLRVVPITLQYIDYRAITLITLATKLLSTCHTKKWLCCKMICFSDVALQPYSSHLIWSILSVYISFSSTLNYLEIISYLVVMLIWILLSVFSM